jgi:hypothetical protein
MSWSFHVGDYLRANGGCLPFEIRCSSTRCRSASAWRSRSTITCRCSISPYGYSTYQGQLMAKARRSAPELRFILNGEDVALARRRARRDAARLSAARAGRCAAARKAARRAIAAPAPCSSAGSSGGALVYESVNACIRFLGSLDGTHVVTVEHLSGGDGRLHPVQQAMVDLPRLAVRLLHARLRHVALRAVDARFQTVPTPGDREGAAGQSVPLHRL